MMHKWYTMYYLSLFIQRTYDYDYAYFEGLIVDLISRSIRHCFSLTQVSPGCRRQQMPDEVSVNSALQVQEVVNPGIHFLELQVNVSIYL